MLPVLSGAQSIKCVTDVSLVPFTKYSELTHISNPFCG